MIFSNIYFAILVLFMVVGLIHVSLNDGAQMPPRNYNLTHTVVLTAVNFLLIYGAVMYAASH